MILSFQVMFGLEEFPHFPFRLVPLGPCDGVFLSIANLYKPLREVAQVPGRQFQGVNFAKVACLPWLIFSQWIVFRLLR